MSNDSESTNLDGSRISSGGNLSLKSIEIDELKGERDFFKRRIKF